MYEHCADALFGFCLHAHEYFCATLRRALSQRVVRAVLPTGASSSDAQVQAALAAFRTAQDKMDASALKQAISKLGVTVSSQVRAVWCMSAARMRTC